MTNDIIEQRAWLATNNPFVLEGEDADEDFFDAANLFEDEEDDEE